MNFKTFLIVAVLVSSVFTAIAMVPPANGATVYLNGQLVESSGFSLALGGGDYRFVRFGSDAAFGVLWGGATHANNVYIVAIKARYLGVGQVYNDSGQLIVANHPIKIYTLYAAQLQDIVEYEDLTGDGVANYTRTYNSTTRSFSDYVSTGDNLYKLANLSASWAPGIVTRSSGPTYRSWDWNLTATDLSYYDLSSKAILPGALPLVRFTFHLNASLVQYDDVTIPQWNVTVGALNGGRYTITNLVRMADLTLPSAKVVHYDLKWDQLIQGWNYMSSNPAASRRLLLEIGTIVGNYVPSDVVMGWMLLHQLGDDGQARYNSTAGPQTVNNTTGVYSGPRTFKSPNVDFGGNWTRIARFLWSTDSTVDNTTQPLYGQVEGGWVFLVVGEQGNVFAGFVLLMGLNYKGGDQILHDPTVTSDVTTDLVFPAAPGGPSPSGPGRSLYGPIILGIVVIVAVALLAYLIAVRRKKHEPPRWPPVIPPSPPQS